MGKGIVEKKENRQANKEKKEAKNAEVTKTEVTKTEVTKTETGKSGSPTQVQKTEVTVTQLHIEGAKVNDFNLIFSPKTTEEVKINSGWVLDGIQLGATHIGGSGGKQRSFTLAAGEKNHPRTR